MKKLSHLSLFLILLVLFSVNVKAQEGQEEKRAYDVSSLHRLGGSRIYTFNNNDVIGTPLLKEEFRNGQFLFTSGDKSEVVPINFDLEQNLILYKQDDQILILNNLNVKGFSLEKPKNSDSSESIEEKYTFQINHDEFDVNGLNPVQIIYDQNGKTKLYAVKKVKFVRGNTQDPFSGKITNRYKNETEYFLETPDHKMHKLRKLRAKDIIKALGGETEKDLNAYIQEHNLDDRSEKDLVKLLAYYDQKMTVGDE